MPAVTNAVMITTTRVLALNDVAASQWSGRSGVSLHSSSSACPDVVYLEEPERMMKDFDQTQEI